MNNIEEEEDLIMSVNNKAKEQAIKDMQEEGNVVDWEFDSYETAKEKLKKQEDE